MNFTEELVDQIFNHLGYTNTLIWVLIIMIGLNISMMFLNYYFQSKLKDREKDIHRVSLINIRAIKVQERIYSKMERLTLFTREEDTELLKEIQSLQQYVSNKNIFLTKGLIPIINDYLDYFRTVLTDYRKKDIRIEQDLLSSYGNEFSK
jgi:hypothetical protein